VLLVKAAIDLDAWWLAGAILLTGFLVTIALGRVFLLAFWRGGADAPAASGSAIAAYLPLIALMVPIAILGVFPRRFIEIADRAAAGLLDTAPYIRAVFPAGGG
jgi:multicomponent Na+:H+ antiporter subunit D